MDRKRGGKGNESRSTFYVKGHPTLHRNTFEECSDLMTQLTFNAPSLQTNGNSSRSTGEENGTLRQETKPNPAYERQNGESGVMGSKESQSQNNQENALGENVNTKKKKNPKRQGAFRRIWSYAINGCSSGELPSSDESDNGAKSKTETGVDQTTSSKR